MEGALVTLIAAVAGCIVIYGWHWFTELEDEEEEHVNQS